MKQQHSVLVLAFLLTNCTYFDSKHTYNVKCIVPDVHVFNLQNDIIRFKIVGYLEEDAEIYVQSFDPNRLDGGSGIWGIAKLKKGKVYYEDGFETYDPQGRVVYIPRGKREIHSTSTKEHLAVYINTGYD